ncbi:class II glutamine amidotransferase [Testudinibacter sp. TR-2022]|uniref:class II glutamine amidotransferase n=1 Tax=Testudinibacter sp. TR-2022 TaxID=2585029 RepID=UPI001119669C|nr:class II glutamine amidotransferase [Testudinibacter sp. TR-2022]TNH02577.1 class II glutamine amidotransferase [Pasteurellaceae bacterium Phil31]TNH08385.1 class II glutamine amidotransferase [Testudinibacter sp. TR-2022]TNH09146.1 class II glutamine amidotransferase [Testudinibacter sp. TR-2022]
MCQLLGMNCNTPTDIVFSFEGFRCRGGLTDSHADGFGIGFFEDKGVRLFHDDKASATSPVADLVRNYPIQSKNVIAHIRKATQGPILLANTHPFMREMWGQYWLFAHNGNLKGFQPNEGQYYRPVGTTDSEAAFCYLLETLRQKFDHAPSLEQIFTEVNLIAQEVRQYGLLNFLLSNGEWLIAHTGSLLHYIVRKAPFGEAKLVDDDVQIDFASVTTPNDRVAVIATLPLTDNENWQQLAVNELALFQDGEILLRHTPPNPYYPTEAKGLEMALQAV